MHKEMFFNGVGWFFNVIGAGSAISYYVANIDLINKGLTTLTLLCGLIWWGVKFYRNRKK